jgi:hypothetical protein
MSTKGTALKPDFFMAKMPSLVKDKEAEAKGATDEERSLYALSQTQGWKILREYIDNIVNDLDLINSVAIEKGATFDVIGQNAVVINLAKSLIKRIPQKVDDAKESCTQPDGTER